MEDCSERICFARYTLECFPFGLRYYPFEDLSQTVTELYTRVTILLRLFAS